MKMDQLPNQTMLSAVLYGKEDVRVERIPVPPVGVGEVRVKIHAALTCGTDLKVFRRGYHARMIAPPVPFGHEFAGTIDAIGVGVSGWEVGNRVVAANSAPCGDCFYCNRARPELCEDLLFVNGAYAEYITLPARVVEKNLLPVPNHVPFHHAALTEPLACVVRGLQDTPAKQNEFVTVIGAGPIGLMFIRLAALAGSHVTAVGRGGSRLDSARTMGADHCLSVNSEADIVSSVRDLANGGRGPDLVIECVGLPETWELAMRLARPGGTVNLFGGCPKDTFARLDTARVHYEELTLLGTFHHTPETVREALGLIADGSIPAEKFIQAQATLSEVPDVLARMAAFGGAVKTAVFIQETESDLILDGAGG